MVLLRRSGKQVDPARGQSSTVHGEVPTLDQVSIYLKGAWVWGAIGVLPSSFGFSGSWHWSGSGVAVRTCAHPLSTFAGEVRCTALHCNTAIKVGLAG